MIRLFPFNEFVAHADTDEERWGPEPIIDDWVATPPPCSPPASSARLSVMGTIGVDYADCHDGFAPEITCLERLRLRLQRYSVPLGDPVPDYKLIKALASQVPKCVHPEKALWKASPIHPPSVTSAGFLEQIFNKGEAVRLCAGLDERGLAFIVGSDWSETIRPGPDEVFFCPNPVHASQYADPYKKRIPLVYAPSPSRVRYLSACFPYNKDTAMRVSMRLPLPIVSITDCGPHGIYVLVAIPATAAPGGQIHQKQLINHLVALGATIVDLKPRGLSRLPQACHDGVLQQSLYLNPNPAIRPIFPRFDDD